MPVVDVQHLLPRVARVIAHEHTAFLVRTEGVSDRRHVDLLRVERVDDDARDVPGVGEAEMPPRLPAVGGLVHAVAERDRVADVRLAGPDVDHLGIGRVDRHVADRLHRLLVEQRCPTRASVGRLPHAARRGCDVDGARIAGDAFDVAHAPRHVGGPDIPVRQASERRVRERGRGGARAHGRLRSCRRRGLRRDDDRDDGHGQRQKSEHEAAHRRISGQGLEGAREHRRM